MLCVSKNGLRESSCEDSVAVTDLLIGRAQGQPEITTEPGTRMDELSTPDARLDVFPHLRPGFVQRGSRFGRCFKLPVLDNRLRN